MGDRDERSESFHSIDQQIEAATKAVPGGVAATFQDLDKTGRNTNREGLDAALAWIAESPKTRGLAVHDLSRLARNQRATLELIEELNGEGSAFISAKEQMDTETATGKMMLGFFASLHQYTSDALSDRWKETQAGRVAKGLSPNNGLNYGYQWKEYEDYGKTRRRPVPDPETAPILRSLYERYVAGQGMVSLVKHLNDEGHEPPGQRSGRKNAAKVWSASTLLQILRSGYAAGYITYHGELVAGGKHEAIISEELWQAYLTAKRKRATRRVGPKSDAPKMWLAGVLTCGRCGSLLWITGNADSRNTQVQCSNYMRTRTCKGVFAKRRNIIWQVTLGMMELDAEMVKEGIAGQRVNTSTQQAQLAVIEAELLDLDEELTKTIDYLTKGILTESEGAAKLREIRPKIALAAAGRQALRDELAGVQTPEEIGAAWQQIMENMGAVFPGVPGEADGSDYVEPTPPDAGLMRDLVLRVVERIVVLPVADKFSKRGSAIKIVAKSGIEILIPGRPRKYGTFALDDPNTPLRRCLGCAKVSNPQGIGSHQAARPVCKAAGFEAAPRSALDGSAKVNSSRAGSSAGVNACRLPSVGGSSL